MPGYPDWQQYANRITPNFLPNLSPTLPVGNTVLGPYLVASYDAVELRVVLTAGFGTITVQWSEDAAGLLPVGSDVWSLSTSWGLLVIIPVEAPYVTLTINNASAVNMTGTTKLAGKATGVPRIYYPITQNHLRVNSHSLAASGQEITPLPWIQAGTGYLSYVPGDTSGKLAVTLHTVHGSLGLNYFTADLGAPTAQGQFTIGVVDEAFALVVTNTDAVAAHSYAAYLVVVPG